MRSWVGWAGFGPAIAATGEEPTVVDPLSDDVPEAGVAGIKITSTLTFNDVLERTMPASASAPASGAATSGGSEGDYDGEGFEADDKKGLT